MLKLFGVLPSILIVQIVSICWAEDSTVFHAVAPRSGVAKGPAPTSLILTKTVGTDPNTCASTNTLQALVGQKIYYCFDIENVSSLTFDLHTLADSEVGAILTDFPYALAPSSRVFVTAEQTIYESVIGTATWSAVDMDTATTASSIASTTVTVPPPVTLRKTVGIDPQICASTDEITVNSGTNVYYCFEITNNSQATFDIHSLVDSEVGPILTDFPYMLAPAASVFVTAEQTVGSSVIGTATWTVYEEITGMPFNATATTKVHVPTPTPTP
ncbi:MAG: hypothetical protein KC964_27405, partial [Candidatus Omnitrophica bacterium]|nr:hypothetical protein [Candidatus Omnitrophota bacterium]